MADHLRFRAEDGSLLIVTNMFDVDGDETTEPEMAFSIVAQLPNGQWLASECWSGDLVCGKACLDA